MHILFLTDNFPPEVNAPASRTHEHCREWVRRGHRVTVITCAPNFPKGKVFPGYRNRLWQRETIDSIEVVRVWSYISANEAFAKRILDYVSFAITATIAALFVRRCDVVIGTSPQFFAAAAGWLVGALKRIPFVFELRDLWPESIKAVGAMQQSAALDALERFELFLYRRAALVVSVTHAFKDDLVRRGIDPSKIVVVTNGVDIDHFKPVGGKDPLLASKLGLEGCYVAGYVGTHGMAHALGTILDAAEYVRGQAGGKDVRFLLLGDGAQKKALVEEAAARGLNNVLFIDTVPKSEVARYWTLLDVSIIHLRNVDLFQTVIPSKLFESCGMGIPIAHGVAGESAGIVTREGVGLLFQSEDGAALANVVLRLKNDPILAGDLRARCLAAAPKFDRHKLANLMLDEVERIVRAQ